MNRRYTADFRVFESFFKKQPQQQTNKEPELNQLDFKMSMEVTVTKTLNRNNISVGFLSVP